MRAPLWATAATLLIALQPARVPAQETSVTRIPDEALAIAPQLREAALASRLGYEVTESLTTEVGPRMAGSEADARAVKWAEAKFRELGFDKVWLEPVTFPKWIRRSESARVLGDNAQPLTLTALGGSPAGTDSHRQPHTGITRFDEGLIPIPSAALSVPDAQQLSRLLALGPQRVHMALDCGWDGEATSHNVIGEITGSETPEEVVLIGAHLDSWDLGTGAVDDAAGVGITMAAAKLIGDLPRHPARSIRVVAFANEEQGLLGGRAYAEKHAADLTRHVIAAESDFGAGRVYAFATGAPESARAAEIQIAAALAPLGIEHAPGKGGPGPDLIPFAQRGMAWAWLAQDGTDYFDLHHTPDDTFDKIDPDAVAQNVAAYAVFAYLAASAEGGFGSAPKPAVE